MTDETNPNTPEEGEAVEPNPVESGSLEAEAAATEAAHTEPSNSDPAPEATVPSEPENVAAEEAEPDTPPPVSEDSSSEEASDSPDQAEPDQPEPDQADQDQEENVPRLTLGDGESDEDLEGMEEGVYVAPTIRGRIDKFGVAMGTGRRKTSVARVRIKEGTGVISINGRTLEDYFCTERDRAAIVAPLKATERFGKVDVWVRVRSGGTTGQTGAVVLGISRALTAIDESLHTTLSHGGFLTRDERMVERKKYGYKKARKSFQFSKR